jgi:hypothetical protein
MVTMEITASDSPGMRIEAHLQPAPDEQASDHGDCASLAELPLSALLYRVLVSGTRVSE